TVIGMAPLLNSIHAISIGSTTPEGTLMRIGDTMLIWRARAPMIRAFSNRVKRIAGPRARPRAKERSACGDGRRGPESGTPTSTLLSAVTLRDSGSFWHVRRLEPDPNPGPAGDIGSSRLFVLADNTHT